MSILEQRGGVPHVFRADIDTTGRKHDFRQMAKYIQVQAVTNPVRLYFSLDDYTNDVNYLAVPVAAATHPWGWEGPAEVSEIWLKGDGGTSSVQLVAFLRRG